MSTLSFHFTLFHSRAFADTSTALYQVASNPNLPSAMSEWVPCLNNLRIGQAARFAAYTSIKLLNQEVTEKFPRALQILQVDSICAPFGPPDNFSFDPSLCSNSTILVQQFAEVRGVLGRWLSQSCVLRQAHLTGSRQLYW